MSVDLKVQAVLESLVRACVNAGMMFTVYDLTKAIRSKNLFLKHQDSREIVHGLYEDDMMRSAQGDAYTRTLVDLGGADGPCYVYHHPNDDPNLYQNLIHQALSTINIAQIQASAPQTVAPGVLQPSPSKLISASPQTPASSTNMTLPNVSNAIQKQIKQLDTKKRRTDRWNRLRLPAAQLKQAGINPKDVVYVCYRKSDDSVTIERQRPQDGQYDVVRRTTVDQYRNIRFTLPKSARRQQYAFNQTLSGRLMATPA